MNETTQLLRTGRVRLDPASREVWIGSQQIDVRPPEFDVLQAFLRHKGRVLGREQLLAQVWGYNYFGDTRTVDVHVASLRDKLRDSNVSIVTVWGIGYKLVEEK